MFQIFLVNISIIVNWQKLLNGLKVKDDADKLWDLSKDLTGLLYEKKLKGTEFPN